MSEWITKNLRFGNVLMPCFIVTVDGEDYKLCSEASHNRWSSTKKGQYGRGILNNSNDNRKTERIGLLGEMAFGKVFGIEPDLKYRKNGDFQDFKIPAFYKGKQRKFKVDVKTASYCYNKGLVCVGVNNEETGKFVEYKLNKDLYVFGYLEEEQRDDEFAKVVLIGGQDKLDIQKRDNVPGKGNNINKEIPYKELHSIEKIHRWVLDSK